MGIGHHCPKLLDTTRPYNDYSCYGALEIVSAITITIIIVKSSQRHSKLNFAEMINSVLSDITLLRSNSYDYNVVYCQVDY